MILRPTASFDGRDIKDIPLAEMRHRIAVVPQEAPLVRSSVLDNIALGEIEPNRDRAALAAQLAQAEEFILSDPLGYDRMLNEDGIGLSAGQRQRIAIARALYRQPQVLILDEPTSALDSESEYALMRSLQSLHGQRTMIIITHRLRTAQKVDHIFVVEGGRVVEAGPPENLSLATHCYKRRRPTLGRTQQRF